MSENGAAPSPAASAFISHLGSLPVVNDGVATFKDHPLGQKSIAISNSAYDTLVKPFGPYIAKANGYAGPYLTKVDGLADSGLDRVESTFPIVKEPTDKIKGRISDTVTYPQRKASDIYASGASKASDIYTAGTNKAVETKDYVIKVYNDELNKIGDKGVVPMAKAAVVTYIVLSAQTVSWIASFLTAKKEEAKEVVEEKTS